MGQDPRGKSVFPGGLDDCAAEALDRECHVRVLSNGESAFQTLLVTER